MQRFDMFVSCSFVTFQGIKGSPGAYGASGEKGRKGIKGTTPWSKKVIIIND